MRTSRADATFCWRVESGILFLPYFTTYYASDQNGALFAGDGDTFHDDRRFIALLVNNYPTSLTDRRKDENRMN